MTTLEIRMNCPLANGMHARPAAALAAVASRFESQITLHNARTEKKSDAKSPLGSITIDLRVGDEFRVEIVGSDAEAAHAALSRYLRDEFPHSDDPIHVELPAGGPTPLPPCLAQAAPSYAAGTRAVGGVARGHLVDIRRDAPLPESATRTDTDPHTEWQRVRDAMDRLLRGYDALASRAQTDVERTLILAHRAILDDRYFSSRIEETLTRERFAAGRAIHETSQAFGDELRATQNPLLAARADDIADICRRLLIEVYGKEIVATPPTLKADSIGIADTLLPSEFMALDHSRLRGLVLGRTAPTAHVVILARSRGIPTIIGLSPAALRFSRGQEVILDGELGFLVTDPSPAVLRYYELERRRIADRSDRDARDAAGPARTADGRIVTLQVNASNAADVERGIARGATGVGLLRTELLFADRTTAPTEDEQYDLYRAVVEAADGGPVTIRLFDCGGDKPLAFMPAPSETNPFLGWRGVRMYDGFPDLIDAQIRAIVRASSAGPVRILVPMVTVPEEMRRIRERVENIEDAIGGGDKDRPAIPVGAMIEVPAAALIVDQLSPVTDFFSIGSNDLAQYCAASDRENPRVSHLTDALSPALLRLMHIAGRAAARTNRSISICGEIAGDPAAIALLLAMGVAELSMAPDRLVAARARLRRLRMDECRLMLDEALTAKSADDVRAVTGRSDAPAIQRPLLDPDLVLLDVDAASRAEAIKMLVDRLYASGRTNAPHALEHAVWQREQLSSTGLGFGFAVPHCKNDGILANSVAVARLAKPIVWDEDDDEPTRVVFLLAVRKSSAAKEYMDVLKTLAVKIMDDAFRESMLRTESAAALFDAMAPALTACESAA